MRDLDNNKARKPTQKQSMIAELMEGNDFGNPMDIEKKLNRKSESVVSFYYYYQYKRGASKKHTIDNIIRIG